MALLRRLLPRVHKHLQQVGVGPLLYLPEWFLCLFARSLPFPTVLRVWDAFLSEGEWGLPGGWWGQGSQPWVLGMNPPALLRPPALAILALDLGGRCAAVMAPCQLWGTAQPQTTHSRCNERSPLPCAVRPLQGGQPLPGPGTGGRAG